MSYSFSNIESVCVTPVPSDDSQLVDVQCFQQRDEVFWEAHSRKDVEQLSLADTVKCLAVVDKDDGDLSIYVERLFDENLESYQHVRCASTTSEACLFIWELLLYLDSQPLQYYDETDFACMTEEGNGSVVRTFFGVSRLVDLNI